ncbi:hypothetical protein Taro_046203 [Colocasia esculenta]|uniref:Uncharacterized protein n=1 Tax=Colocasia esculenta TaxID=4460 RepID=A0A843WRN4_COLES|nr:hypothetical protein [Colocasia esculenta]
MQSRLALLFLGSSPRSLGRQLHRSWSRAATVNTTAAGAGDPAVHAELPQDEDAQSAEAEQQRRVREGGGRESPLVSSFTKKSSPFAPAPKLESSEVPRPVDPAFQQRRKLPSPELALEDVSCVGWDGKPLVGGAEGEEQEQEQEEERTKDYKEYFDHHKPTPLSELEFADTRRPIRQATDSDVVDDDAGVGEGPRGWREEQKDTVDEALLRAEAMFRAAAERGDPDTTHGRVLASYQRLVLL